VGHHSEAFVRIDTAKSKNAVAIAEAGRGGEVRYLGEFDSREAVTRKLVAKLAGTYRKLTFCYEAGPTGYGLYRVITSLGHDCARSRQNPDAQLAGSGARTGDDDARPTRT
jgi:transposase